MAPKGKSLEVLLADAGQPDEFIEYALSHSDSYRNGDLNGFISFIEHMMQCDEMNKQRIETDSPAMDSGSKRVEHDYTGDNLTHGGYDHVDESRRW
jgi:hypothetical protein